MNKFPIEINDNIISQKGIEAIIDFYSTMSFDRLEKTNVTGYATAIDSPFLNVVLDIQQNREDSAELIRLFSNFFDKHHVPWAWLIIPAIQKHDLAQHGFELLEEVPAMYFCLDKLQSLPKPPLISFQEVNDDLKQWVEPINEGFEVKEGDHKYRKLNATIMKTSPGKLKQFVAFYDNQIASAGTLFRSNDSVMIHNLATKKSFTKRGIGTALTLHMMEQAKMLGYKHCFLDASEDGFNLYRQIGFKIYSTTLVLKLKGPSISTMDIK